MELTSFRVMRSDFCIASPFLILIKGGVCLCKMCTDVHALYVFMIPFLTINLKFFVPPFLFFYVAYKALLYTQNQIAYLPKSRL